MQPALRPLAGLGLILTLLTAGTAGAGASEMGCETPDNVTRVAGAKLCLAIKTWAPAQTGSISTLLVFLHGDVSRGGPADYLFPTAEAYGSPTVVSVAMLRPGYYDRDGNRSTGDNFDRRDSYTQENIGAIAEALQNLKRHHGADKLVVLGHSGGAAIAGVILGTRPGLIDAALLLSCPCNIPRWRADRGRSRWKQSLSAHSFLDSVPDTTKVVAVTGEKDRNTGPHLARDYASALRERGVDATFVLAPDGSHSFRSLPVREQLDRLLQALAKP